MGFWGWKNRGDPFVTINRAIPPLRPIPVLEEDEVSGKEREIVLVLARPIPQHPRPVISPLRFIIVIVVIRHYYSPPPLKQPLGRTDRQEEKRKEKL